MRYDKRHFAKLEDLRTEVAWTMAEIDLTKDLKLLKEKLMELKESQRELREYKRVRPASLRRTTHSLKMVEILLIKFLWSKGIGYKKLNMKKKDTLKKTIQQYVNANNIVKFVIGPFQNQYRINGVALYTLDAHTKDNKVIDADELKAELEDYFRKIVRQGMDVPGAAVRELFPDDVKVTHEVDVDSDMNVLTEENSDS